MAKILIEDEEVEIVSAEEFCDMIKDKVNKDQLYAVADLILSKLNEYPIVETPFGSFRKLVREERTVRNPQTGEQQKLKAKTLIRWHPTANMQL